MVKATDHFKNIQFPQIIKEGERNATIFNYSAALKRNGASVDDVCRLAKEANKDRCKPPMGDAEVDQIVRNVFTYCNDDDSGLAKSGGGDNPVKVGSNVSPTEQAARQLELMFEENELISFVTKFFKNQKGELKPGKNVVSRLSQKVIKELREAKSMEEVFPGYNKQAGILLCVNPMDYGSRKDKGVKAFRHTVIEYDDIPLDEQARRLLDSGLPVSSMTYSGGKSIHAMVRVDAKDADDYKRKVKSLHKKLTEKYGSPCDAANKNPSRLTRLAGSQRGKKRQTLLYTEVNLDAKLDDFLKQSEELQKQDENLGFNEVAEILMKERGACLVEGVPVIRSDGDFAYGRDEVYKAILDIKPNAASGFRKEVMGYINLKGGNRKQAESKYVYLKNGILDTETLELLPNDGTRLLLNKIPHNWNPDAKAPLVDKVFNDIALGDPAVVANLWEMFGLSLYRGHEVSRMILLQGGGANGKSTLPSMLKRMLGENNCFSLSIQDLGEKFQLVPSMGKLALVGDDIASDFVGAKACAVMKKFVTGETVSDQYKGGETFQFEPYATLIYSCNEIPRFADSTFGFERRVHPIPLSARFAPADEGYDSRLKQKLCEEECIEYVLVKSVEALRRCLDGLALTPNRLSEEMKKDILQENNPILSYIEERKAEGYVFVGKTNGEVHGDYTEWCNRSHFEPVKINSFSKTLCSRERLTTESSNGSRKYTKLAS